MYPYFVLPAKQNRGEHTLGHIVSPCVVIVWLLFARRLHRFIVFINKDIQYEEASNTFLVFNHIINTNIETLNSVCDIFCDREILVVFGHNAI